MSSSDRSTQSPREIDSLALFLCRIFWAGLGPVILVLVVMGIVTRGTGWTTPLDVLFAAVVVAMILARWCEQRSGAAVTLEGKPAGPLDFMRYWVRLLGVAAALWIAANIVGNHVLN